MSADYLIALDNAQAELGDLYTAARRYRELVQAADAELLPALTELGLRLRSLRRRRALPAGEIAAAADAMHELQGAWEARVRKVRQGRPYRDAVAAYARDDQRALAALIPGLFSTIETIGLAPAAMHFGVRVSAPRRGVGDPPFLSSSACVERLLARAAAGFAPTGSDDPAEDLASIPCAADPHDLDSPVALAIDPRRHNLTVFRQTTDGQHMVFTPLVQGPFRAVLCESWTDDWWEANEESYAEFRDHVAGQLRSQGWPAAIHSDHSGA